MSRQGFGLRADTPSKRTTSIKGGHLSGDLDLLFKLVTLCAYSFPRNVAGETRCTTACDSLGTTQDTTPS